MNINVWTIFCLIVGWSLKCIYDDFTKPKTTTALRGQATVSIAPTMGGPSSADVASVINVSMTALNVLASWLEELQVANPRLPEECLTARQWLEASLNVAEQVVAQQEKK